MLLDINNFSFSKTIVHVIRKSHEFSFRIVRVITIVVSNPVNVLVNVRPMTSEHCQRLLDDVTIFRNLAVESTFLYSLHPEPDSDRPITALQTPACDWLFFWFVEVNFLKLTESNKIVRNNYVFIHYNICKISTQIIECNFVTPCDFL